MYINGKAYPHTFQWSKRKNFFLYGLKWTDVWSVGKKIQNTLIIIKIQTNTSWTSGVAHVIAPKLIFFLKDCHCMHAVHIYAAILIINFLLAIQPQLKASDVSLINIKITTSNLTTITGPREPSLIGEQSCMRACHGNNTISTTRSGILSSTMRAHARIPNPSASDLIKQVKQGRRRVLVGTLHIYKTITTFPFDGTILAITESPKSALDLE